MKKYIVSLMILFGMYDCSAMELAKLSSEDDTRCFQVARYLHKYPQGRDEGDQIALFFQDTNPERAALAQGVKKYQEAFKSDEVQEFIHNLPSIRKVDGQDSFEQILLEKKKLSCDGQEKVELLERHNVLLALAFNKDVFVTQCRCYFPESFEDVGGFFNAEFYEHASHTEDIIFLPLGGHIKKPKKSDTDKKISAEDMIQKLLQMPIEDTFFAFRYVTQRNVLQSTERFEHLSDNGCFNKGRCRYKPGKSGALSATDLKQLTEEQENLLKNILEKSNAASRDSEDNPILFAELFEIKEEHIAILQSKEGIRELDCFQDLEHPCNQALIYITCRPSTNTEKIKDKIVFAGPHLLAMVMPDFISMQTAGFLQGMGGLFAAGLGGYLLGHPVIDAYHSDRGKLVGLFGTENQGKVNRRWLCFVSIVHYISAAIAQKFFAWRTIPGQLIAGVIYIGRGCFSSLLMKSMEDYNDPFKRSNKKGYHYTLGDLIRGPLFDNNQQQNNNDL